MADEPRTAQNVVTSENRQEFMAKKLELEIPVLADKTRPAETVADKTIEGDKTTQTAPPKKDKHDINERFSKMAEDRKAAEAKAATAEAAAKTEREAREKVEREAAELREKLKPTAPPSEALPAEPTRDKFTSDADFAKAIAEHAVAKAMRERDEKERTTREEQARTQIVQSWEERLAATKQEVPDYAERIEKAKDVKLSDQARDAILESEVGPKLLLHFADHPQEAIALGKLTVGQMLRQLGKLEAMIESKAVPKETVTPKEETKNTVEISKAPEPATPLKGSAAGTVELIDSKGEFKGDYQQWKAARKAGKIK